MSHQDFIDFLNASPTPYHATANLVKILENAGFTRLDEACEWSLTPGGKYVYSRSDTTVVGFTLGQNTVKDSGFRVVGAHTDSPCLKVKPKPELSKKGYQQVGIEVYGGALLNPWFDRDLSLAGKVSYTTSAGKLRHALVNFERPVAVLPSLAIHLNREVNQKKSVNPQKEMNPIFFQGEETFSLAETVKTQLQAQGEADVEDVLGMDLSFFDTQSAAVVGLKNEYFAGARLDNLLSSFFAVKALAECNTNENAVVICHDHEEVGSCSEPGAQGTTLKDLVSRIEPNNEAQQVALRKSLMLSVDNAHGVHPNYADSHDDGHGPLLNRGPVIKFDANQSYATTHASASFLQTLAADKKQIPLQQFVTRADMRCGSTIGPMTSANVGIKTIDLGVPTFAMHSVRELAGVEDMLSLDLLLQRFYCAADVTYV